MCNSRKNNIFQTKLMTCMGIIYYTWWMRNEIIFRNVAPDVNLCAKKVIDECKLRATVKLKLEGRRGAAMRRRLHL